MFMNNQNLTNEQATAVSTGTGTRGRPPLIMIWPDGPFTVQLVHDNTGISKVTLYNKIKEDLKSTVIETCGQEKSQGGRPKVVYRKKVTPSVVGSTSPETPNIALSSMVAA